jgi:hypothetical protein
MSAAIKHDTRDTDLDRPALERQLDRVWRTPPGLWGAFATVDHKVIGRRYIATAFAFLILGGVLALAIRWQLARPEMRTLSPDLYNQVFTIHGANMMFLFAVPVMEAVGVFIVPLMVGTRNIAFPRLNAFSYWIYLFGGILLWVAFLLGMGPDIGWFGYVPLSGPQYGQARRHLGPDDHLHRGGGARGRRVAGGDRVQAARARHVARPHADFRLVLARHRVPDHHGDARHHGGVHLAHPGPAGGHPLLQPGRGR